MENQKHKKSPSKNSIIIQKARLQEVLEEDRDKPNLRLLIIFEAIKWGSILLLAFIAVQFIRSFFY